MTTTSTTSTASRSNSISKTAPATSSSTAPTDAAVRAGSSALMKGHSGTAITSLQERLNRTGAEPALATDGAFGPKTRAAVERFQQQHNLPVDGKVGARTLAALEAAVAAAPTTPAAPSGPADSLERGGGTSSGRAVPSTPAAPTPTTVAPRRGLRPETATPTPTTTTTSATATALPAGLAADARATINDSLRGTHGPAARTAMTTLMGSAQYRGLAAPAQAQLLTAVHTSATARGFLENIAGGSPSPAARDKKVTDAANQASALMQTTASRNGSAADRGHLVDVFAASPAGRASLMGLAGANGGTNKLASKDLRGGTMLNHLSTMATAPLGRGINRNDLLASTMSEVRNPSTIEQQQQGTCAATTVSLQLVGRSPAEFVRLLAGVSSAAGTTKLANGDTLRRVDESTGDRTTGRSISERLLQDSLMDYANSGDRYTIAGNRGLKSSESSRLQSGIFNEAHHTVGTTGRYAQRDASISERTWVGMRNVWDTVTFKRNADHPMAILRERSGTPTPIAMHWGTKADSNHAVLFTKIENGRVYFQNPHGNARRTVGQVLETPPRRVEQGNVQSMTIAEFERRLFAVSIPD